MTIVFSVKFVTGDQLGNQSMSPAGATIKLRERARPAPCVSMCSFCVSFEFFLYPVQGKHCAYVMRHGRLNRFSVTGLEDACCEALPPGGNPRYMMQMLQCRFFIFVQFPMFYVGMVWVCCALWFGCLSCFVMFVSGPVTHPKSHVFGQVL